MVQTLETQKMVEAEPEEVEALLHNLMGFHLAERDPISRYMVLTREQVLYEALAAAIKRVAGGDQVVDPRLEAPASLKGEREALTPRELEVLQLICEGHSNRGIAGRLHLSANTVAVHRANIMNTLDIHKTAELVMYAVQHGLVSLP